MSSPGSGPSLRPPRELLAEHVTGSQYFFHLQTGRPGRRALVMGGRERCEPNYRVERTHYDFHVLEYVAEGEGEVSLDGRRGRLGPGSVYAYAPDTQLRIRTSAESPMLKYFFCLQGRGARRSLAEGGVAPGRTLRLLAHAGIRGLAEDIVREGRLPGQLASEVSLKLLDVLLLKIRAQTNWQGKGSSAAHERFLGVKALIDHEAAHLGNLREIAGRVGMDASGLCRLFSRYQGTSPYQYLLRRKMNLAAEFLVQGGGTVKEAALRAGFEDPYHFSRCFKAVHGVPPSRLKRR